jgi:hypothetical protein
MSIHHQPQTRFIHLGAMRKKHYYLVQINLSAIFDAVMQINKNTKTTKKHFPQEG